MGNLLHNSINAFPNTSKDLDVKNIPVWLNVWERYPVGAVIDVSAKKFIPAGTPVKIDGLGGAATVLTSSDSAQPCVGFTENDIYSEEACKAQVTIVTRGVALLDRMPEDAATFVGKFPGITFVKESEE